MSKYVANGELRPFSSTSFHQWLSGVAMHMWFGTTSSSSPMPRAGERRGQRVEVALGPELGVQAPWSMTS